MKFKLWLIKMAFRGVTEAQAETLLQWAGYCAAVSQGKNPYI